MMYMPAYMALFYSVVFAQVMFLCLCFFLINVVLFILLSTSATSTLELGRFTSVHLPLQLQLVL